MARPVRIWNPDGCYHVTIRGNNRQDIFREKGDIDEYFRVLYYVYGKHRFELYAYCLMSNHIHLLIRSPDVHLGKLMALLNKRFSDFFRKKYEYTGQIYENRYFSEEIGHPYSLLKVSAYIHGNPIQTKIPLVASMELYEHSSFHYYFHNKHSPHPFLHLDYLPTLLPEHPKTKQAYAELCEIITEERKLRIERVPGTHTT